MKKLHLAIVSLGVAMLAAGCGGGSSGAATGGTTIPSAAVKITQTNAPQAAKAAGSSQSAAKEGGGIAGNVGGVMVQTSAPPKVLWKRAVAKFEQAQSLTQAHPVGVVGVIAGLPFTMNCAVSGTSIFDIQDNNGNAVMDAGDAFVITDASCVEATGYSTNGTITMAIGTATGDCQATSPTTETMSLSMTMANYVDVSPAETLTTNGDMAISLTAICGSMGTLTATISGSNFKETSSVDGVTEMSNYNISYTEDSIFTSTSTYSYSITMTVASVELGGTVTIATTTPISGVGYNEPNAGVIVITGASGSTLTLTAQSDATTVTQVLDDDGAAGPNAPVALASTTWSAI